MTKHQKLQCLLITQLLKQGSVELLLPDGVTVEIGITQQGEDGDLVKADDYCYVIASRENNKAMLDSYNLGLQYEEERNTMIWQDEVMDDDGRMLKTLAVT